jgi:hypothetical protein
MGGEVNCRQDFGGATQKKDILWMTTAYMEDNIEIEFIDIGWGILYQQAVGSCKDGNEPT